MMQPSVKPRSAQVAMIERISVIIPAAVMIIGLVLGSVSVCLGQTPSANDLELVKGQTFSDPGEFAHYHGSGNNDKVIQNHHQNFIAQYNPVSLVLKGAMLGYQKLLSQQLARSCPYEISCSNFSKQAIREFGAFKGVFLSADRLMRCNRIGLLDVPAVMVNQQTGAIIDSPNMYR